LNYKIEKLAGNSFYIPGRVNIGLYLDADRVTLFDSGSDDSSGRALYRLLQEQDLSLERVINTHSNADHVGGNFYLQKKTGCQVWATEIEACITSHPIMEPLLLWSAFPFRELNNKFLRASPSRVDRVIPVSGSVDDFPFEFYPLPGHFINMVGIFTHDEVFYIADALFSEEIIDKYKVMVTLDVSAEYETLSFLENFEAEYFVPCHASPTKSIKKLVEINRKALQETGETILNICSEPVSRERILEGLCIKYNIPLNATQYVLSLATVSAHLTYLADMGHARFHFEEGKMLWERAV